MMLGEPREACTSTKSRLATMLAMLGLVHVLVCSE